ncbi:lipase family protein [Nocardia sp. NPDC020380]|uniref:lipase family protein n=1 Tax=Nocardia sp. NPDC020380 TaxID=3364309 RepID=UPI0037B83AE9
MIRIKTRAVPRLLAALLAAVVVSAGSTVAVANAVPALPGLPPGPAADPFYAQPPSLTQYKMGDVVDSRPVALRDIPARTNPTAWQVKYVSQDTNGKPWTTVATIIRPEGGAQLSKLLVFDPWIDALDTRCNPSYQLRAGAGFMAGTGMVSELPDLIALLDRGYTMVVPDYLGPDNQFTAAYVEGRNTIDGARAALNFAPAGLSPTTPVGMFGYSGGARGTEFAAELAPAYAPELNLVGVVAIGIPVSLANSGLHMNKSLFTGIDVSSAFGLGRAYPELDVPAMFTDPDLGDKIGSVCNAEAMATYAFADGRDMTVNRIWPLDEPKMAAVVASIVAGKLGTPRAPLYLGVGANDEVALPQDNDALAADYRRRGVDLTYEKFPVVNHPTSIGVAALPSMEWLAARLDHA